MKTILIIVALLVAGMAMAQSAPRWTANNPSTGAISCHSGSAANIVSETGLTMIEVTALTACELSFYTRTSAGYAKLSPLSWFALSDTTIAIPAGVTKAFTFNDPCKFIYLTSGTANFAGE